MICTMTNKKPKPPKLKVIQGSRHELERELMSILLTEFGSDRDELFENALNKIKRKGNLKRVK